MFFLFAVVYLQSYNYCKLLLDLLEKKKKREQKQAIKKNKTKKNEKEKEREKVLIDRKTKQSERKDL